MNSLSNRNVRVAIIGAGPGGLCMGKRLLDEGFDNFVMLEKSDGVGGTWNLTLESGETVVADVVVSAIGMFNGLTWPDIEGLDSFTGTMFHSAQWDWSHDLGGEQVAVIGSAASAVQFVPEIRKVARQGSLAPPFRSGGHADV